MIRLLYFSLICYCLIAAGDILNNSPAWYWGYAYFSDWRGKPCDFSTNAVVTNHYNPPGIIGGPTLYLRGAQFDEFLRRIDAGDTLTVGLDYYAHLPASRRFIPPGILRDHNESLARGAVLLFECYGNSKEGVHWRMK